MLFEIAELIIVVAREFIGYDCGVIGHNRVIILPDRGFIGLDREIIGHSGNFILTA